MIVGKINRFAAAVLSLFLVANGITASAQGNIGPPGNDSCTLSVPFTVYDKKGWIPYDTVFTIEMAAEGNAPLPDKTLYETETSGEYEFGPIIFDEPGDYEYTIYDSALLENVISTDVIDVSSVGTLTLLEMQRIAAQDIADNYYGQGSLEYVFEDKTFKLADIQDYGSYVLNTVAYQTGNANIGNGYPDDGGTSGRYIFTYLPEGTYTLTEDKAPDGYAEKASSYKIKVTKSTDGKRLVIELPATEDISQIFPKQ